MPKTIVSEGTPFAQLDNKAPHDKKYWKDKECYNFGKKGHPTNHCKKPKKTRKRDSDDDNRSVESTAYSVRKIEKYLKLMQNNFATVNTQLTQLKEAADGSDLLDSAEYEEDSHFQLHFAQVEQKFEP